LGLLPSSVSALKEKPSLKKVADEQAGDIQCIKSTCGLCASHCALFAFVKDGRLIKLEGNPEDQQGGGKLCGKGNAGISLLYDPDRLKYPLKPTKISPEANQSPERNWDRSQMEKDFLG